MAVGQKFAQSLFWCDFETTGLPTGNDFSDVHVLEVAVIVTDFDMEAFAGYREVIKLTKGGADALRANEVVLKMHKVNGLLKEAATATVTLEEAEAGIIEMLTENTTFQQGEFMIAGSGVAAFDHPLIKAKMPKLAKWLAYYPFDIGVMRRTSKILSGGKDVVNPTKASYQDGVKVHRAWDDTQAHIEEATKYRDWFRSVTA